MPAYRAEREAYQLDTLIWHYCRAHVQSYAELKFTSASVFMEAFKFFWAKNVGKIQQDLKANGLIRGFVRGTNAKGDNVLYTFEELLKLACAGINYETKFTFIEDRNALFHSGTATAAQRGVVNIWPQLRPELVRLYDQMDDMILRVLGYRGPIQTWNEPDATLAFTPDRTPLRQ